MENLAVLGICLGIGLIIATGFMVAMAALGVSEKPKSFKEWLVNLMENLLYRK